MRWAGHFLTGESAVWRELERVIWERGGRLTVMRCNDYHFLSFLLSFGNPTVEVIKILQRVSDEQSSAMGVQIHNIGLPERLHDIQRLRVRDYIRRLGIAGRELVDAVGLWLAVPDIGICDEGCAEPDSDEGCAEGKGRRWVYELGSNRDEATECRDGEDFDGIDGMGVDVLPFYGRHYEFWGDKKEDKEEILDNSLIANKTAEISRINQL